MIITLGKCNKGKKHFTKSVTNQITKTCTMIEPFNLREPSVIINYDESLIDYNYASISLNGKTYYYYIMNKVINKHNITLQMHIDSLHTYASEIKSSRCHITRSSIGNKYIIDNMVSKLENNRIVVKNLGTGLNGFTSYVMIKGK